MKFLYFLLICFMISFIHVDAQTKVEVTKLNKAGKTGVENWYFQFGLGYSFTRYPSYYQSILDKAKAEEGVRQFPLGIDFGFYWPLGANQSMLGATLNGVGDSYSDGIYSLQFNHYLLGASYYIFITDIIGVGPFLRFDGGLAFMGLTDGTYSKMSDTGYGLLGSVGYALPISMGTRFLFSGSFRFLNVESESYTSTNIMISLLF